MLELIGAIAVVVVMAKIASNDNQKTGLWVGISILIVAACIFLIPLPFLRLLIAFVACFVAMIGYKMATNS
jgi:hypothetical protein